LHPKDRILPTAKSRGKITPGKVTQEKTLAALLLNKVALIEGGEPDGGALGKLTAQRRTHLITLWWKGPANCDVKKQKEILLEGAPSGGEISPGC